MLHHLRRHAKSWVLKAVLILIILSFALFFGYTSLSSRLQNQQSYVAVVGDVGIPRRTFNLHYQASLDRLRENFKEKMPDNLESILRQNVINQLVSREISYQYAKQLGLAVTDQELAKSIRADKTFSSEGFFDIRAYQERFLPYYRNQYGENFEEAKRRELLLEKEQVLLSLLFSPWQKEFKDLDSNDLFSPWFNDFRETIKVEIFDR